LQQIGAAKAKASATTDVVTTHEIMESSSITGFDSNAAANAEATSAWAGACRELNTVAVFATDFKTCELGSFS